MEAVKILPTKASLTISVSGRGYMGKTVKQPDSFLKSGNCWSLYHFQNCLDKPDLTSQKISEEVVRGWQWDQRRNNNQAELTRIDMSYERSRTGKKSLHQTDQADNESLRITDYRRGHQSHNNVRADASFAEAQGSNADKEDKIPTRRSPSSWARLAGAERPLSPEEELSLSADVQDMLHLECQKEELGIELGRAPTVEEWAAYSGTSIFKLYARVGKGRAAKRKMIAANLPLVNSIAEQFCGRGLSHWELCQEGVQGLLKSADKYDTSYNTKFSTYSFMWIWEKMSAGVKKFRHVLTISRTVYEMASTLLQHKEDLQVLHGRPPSLQELADVSHVDEDMVRNVMRLVKPVKSMDEHVSTLEGRYKKQVEDQNLGCTPWKHIMETELRTEVAKALKCLTPREQRVLEMRYGLGGEPPQGRAQVGLRLDLTYESIRLIEKKALENLRHFAEEDGLHQYLSEQL